MYRDDDSRGVYGTLPRQAALRLYLPHTDESCEPLRCEPPGQNPAERRGRNRKKRRGRSHKS